jgi:hypothetical protein
VSFGQSCCHALADGVLAILDGLVTAPERALPRLDQALRDARIDPDRPWLKPAART